MNRIILPLIFSMLLFEASSQKVYFIYLQSESDQPYFVRHNDKIYNSSANGYLILSKLRDSTQLINIGFPGNKWPEQKFEIKIGAKDHGYLIKNFGERGWGLFDLKALTIQMAIMNEVKSVNPASKTEVSKFTEILSMAVDDSTLRQKPAELKPEERKAGIMLKTEEKKAEPVAVMQQIPGNKIEEKKQESEKIEVLIPPALKGIEIDSLKSEGYLKSVVILKSESSTTEGLGLIFMDQYNEGLIDTISILIPNSKSLIKEVKSESGEGKKFLEIKADTLKIKSDQTLTEIKDTSRVASTIVKQDELTSVKSVLKSDCINTAGDNDFMELRRKMASAMNDVGMMNEARQYFKLKCFSTAQIRNISFLFLNDEGKYKFFDLAYTAVSDLEKFGTLQSELKDDYYINRFKAMIRN